MADLISPGDIVRHPNEPDWGLGQVQTIVGSRITVNFENAGKRVINATRIDLVVVESDPRDIP